MRHPPTTGQTESAGGATEAYLHVSTILRISYCNGRFFKKKGVLCHLSGFCGLTFRGKFWHSIDLRYQPSDLGYDWHKLADGFPDRFPVFLAASADAAAVDSFETWAQRWKDAAGGAVFRERWAKKASL